MAMISLWIFACLELLALASFVLCTLRLKASRPFGIGGASEDLQRARGLYRSTFRWAVVGLVAFSGALILGLSNAPFWRQTGIGGAVLNIGPILAGIGLVWSMGRSVREEWSPRGTTFGVWRETLSGFFFGGLLMLALYLRFGA